MVKINEIVNQHINWAKTSWSKGDGKSNENEIIIEQESNKWAVSKLNMQWSNKYIEKHKQI